MKITGTWTSQIGIDFGKNDNFGSWDAIRMGPKETILYSAKTIKTDRRSFSCSSSLSLP